jgi:hypothetical protein
VAIALKDAKGNPVTNSIQNLNLSNYQTTGTLAPGKYSISLTALATSDDETFNFVNYNLGFTSDSNNTTGGNQGTGGSGTGSPPPLVPLPSAFYSAAAMLILLGTFRLLRAEDRVRSGDGSIHARKRRLLST